MTKYSDIAGQTFGFLTAIKPTKVSGKTLWMFMCHCGNEVIKQASRVADGHIKSCGCLSPYKNIESLEREIFKRTYSDGDLTFEEFRILIRKNCYYCDAKPSNVYNRKNARVNQITSTLIYNGLDRLDSKQPHNFDNVVPCCALCNRLKSDLHVIDFVSHIKVIYNNMTKGF